MPSHPQMARLPVSKLSTAAEAYLAFFQRLSAEKRAFLAGDLFAMPGPKKAHTVAQHRDSDAGD